MVTANHAAPPPSCLPSFLPSHLFVLVCINEAFACEHPRQHPQPPRRTSAVVLRNEGGGIHRDEGREGREELERRTHYRVVC